MKDKNSTFKLKQTNQKVVRLQFALHEFFFRLENNQYETL